MFTFLVVVHCSTSCKYVSVEVISVAAKISELYYQHMMNKTSSFQVINYRNVVITNLLYL